MKTKYSLIFSAVALMLTTVSFAQYQHADAQPLSLSGAIQTALENNYGIMLSELDKQISEINNSWGQAGRYPTISMDLASTNNLNIKSTESSGSSRLAGGVGMRWILFNGFRVQYTKEKLENLEELTSGRSEIVIENTIQDVIEAYYLALLQQERKKVYQKVTELSRDRYTAEEDLKEYGGSVTYQVLQAKNLYLGDQYQLLNQEILVKTALRNLNFLLAEDPDAHWVLSDPFEHQPKDFNPKDLLAKMESDNQIIQNQYIQIDLSLTEKKLAQAAFLPSISLSAGVDNSYTNQYIVNQGNSSSLGMTPYTNLTLSYDLYSGGNRTRAKEIAAIGEEAAQLEFGEMRHRVSNQLLNEYDAYEVRRMQLEVASESLEAAELNLSIAAEKLRTGAINSFNYRDIQLIYLNTAIQKLQAIYALIQSHANLTRLTGGFINYGN